MRRYHHAQMMNIICLLMKTNSKSTRVSKLTVNPSSFPSAPDLAPCPTNKYSHGRAQEITQEQDDRKSTTERTLSAPGGLFHCPFHLDLSHDSSCFTVRLTFDFSPLSLRRGVAVVCFEVTIGESLYLFCLRLVTQGSWLGGSLVSAWSCVASLTCGYGLVFVGVPPFLCLRPYHYEMTQCCHLLHEIANELAASHSFVGWFLFGFCVVLVVCFCSVRLVSSVNLKLLLLQCHRAC